MFEHLVKKSILKALQKIEYGEINITTPEGEALNFKGSKPGVKANIKIDDWRVMVNLGLKGGVGFANDYRQGYWHTSDLISLLSFGLQNNNVLQKFLAGSWLFKQFAKLAYLTKRNTLKGSQKNIQAHYDLGNDFYQLWLDPSMTYSSALFLDENEPLHEAQLNKYDRILNKIPDSGNLLEIGCGWGGFAKRLLQQSNYDYTGITLSHRQREYAMSTLPDSANVLLRDYRHQDGKYDVIVSIEMLEAVGEKYWPTYFKKIKSLLKPGGKALIQTIVIADDLFASYKQGADMIRSYIFPGGMLLSPSCLEKQITQAGLRCEQRFSFGESYDRTLQQWLGSFDQIQDRLSGMGYDKSFQRMWRFYLAACSATFSTKRTDVLQLEIVHA